jgi:hypothetical protein
MIMTRATADTVKSLGHIAFSGAFEFFADEAGDVFRALVCRPLLSSGRRTGQFECHAAAWPARAAIFGMGPAPEGARLLVFEVVRGSRVHAIRAGMRFRAVVAPMGPDYGHQVSVLFLVGHRDGQASVKLYVSHENRLSDPEFNLNDGGGKAVLRVQVIPSILEGGA